MPPCPGGRDRAPHRRTLVSLSGHIVVGSRANERQGLLCRQPPPSAPCHCRDGLPVPAVRLTKAFFEDIRKLIVSARTTLARGVDLVQVHTNFEIGRRIVEQEQRGKDRATYGQEVVKALAARL